MNINVPVGSTATVYIPAFKASDVNESGNSLQKAKYVTFLRMENGYVVVEVASGDYKFESVI